MYDQLRDECPRGAYLPASEPRRTAKACADGAGSQGLGAHCLHPGEHRDGKESLSSPAAGSQWSRPLQGSPQDREASWEAQLALHAPCGKERNDRGKQERRQYSLTMITMITMVGMRRLLSERNECLGQVK